MKKKLFTLLLVTSLTLSLIACGNTSETSQPEENSTTDTATEKNSNSSYDNSTLEGILSGIETDFADTIKHLEEQFTETNTAIGETYEKYVENKQLLTDWYTLILTEEDALFTRTKERSIEYFKLISSSIDHADDNAIDDSMDEFYDRIYDDVMDEFYDAIYDNLMDDAYDMYYDGIVADGYDVAPYDEWSDEWSDELSDCYDLWSDTLSDVYDNWSDTLSDLYDYWSDVNSEFYDNNFDIDDILNLTHEETAENSKTENKTKEKEESSKKESNTSSGIRPEFQDAMDEYEAFFDEYVDFMKEYNNADTNDMIDMVDDYADYMKQYAEVMEKFEALENDDLSTEEALYYAEVSARISAKLLKVEM